MFLDKTEMDNSFQTLLHFSITFTLVALLSLPCTLFFFTPSPLLLPLPLGIFDSSHHSYCHLLVVKHMCKCQCLQTQHHVHFTFSLTNNLGHAERQNIFYTFLALLFPSGFTIVVNPVYSCISQLKYMTGSLWPC